jgi:hypothetical protein
MIFGLVFFAGGFVYLPIVEYKKRVKARLVRKKEKEQDQIIVGKIFQ